MFISTALSIDTESRAYDLFNQFKCVVCQGQSLAESNAPLAKQMRELIREQLKAGKTEEEIIRYLTERYGEAILMKPPLTLANIFLWAGPFIMICFGLFIVWKCSRPSSPKPANQ